MRSRTIGIDLGTSSSLVAVLENGQPKLIPDRHGRTSMPSLVVIREDRSILVGHDAENEARKYSEKNLLIASLKRSMGKNKEYGWHDSRMPVQVLTAIILAELRLRAEAYLGEAVERAVIAVPANFSFTQRQFTKEAALIAGLEPLRIVNEATASLCIIRDGCEGRVITADLGGGTFDVSAIEFDDGVFQVEATLGDEHLGGDDFSECMSQMIVKRVEEHFSAEYLRSDPITSQRLMDAAEDAKKQLSSSEIAQVNIPFVRMRNGSYSALECTVKRKEFESECVAFFERIDTIIEKVLRTSEGRKKAPVATVISKKKTTNACTRWLAGLFSKDEKTPKQPSAESKPQGDVPQGKPVLWLIGNASRTPEIRRRLQYKYRLWHPTGILDLKEPVALGAATIAGILEGTEKKTLLIDVTSNTLGIETQGGVATPIIAKNTTIPASKFHIFTTVEDNQTSLSARIIEGEKPLSKDNKIIGTLHITNIPPAPKGVPKIEVRFNVDASGLLLVKGTDLGTKRHSEVRCTELILPDKKLNEYHVLVHKWAYRRRHEHL